MTPTETGTSIGLTITEAALAKVREVMTQQNLDADERNLRVFVEGGGCCGGPGFGLAFDRAQPEDTKFEHGGMTVVIDPMSLPFCAGASIDYVDSADVQGFKVSAPAMKAMAGGCSSGGCGSGGCSPAPEAEAEEHSHGGGGGCCGSGGGGCH